MMNWKKGLFAALAAVTMLASMVSLSYAACSSCQSCKSGQCGAQSTQASLTVNDNQDVLDLRNQIQSLRAEAARLQSSIDNAKALKAQRVIAQHDTDRAIVRDENGTPTSAFGIPVQQVRNLVADEDIVRISRSNDDQLRVQPIQLITAQPVQRAAKTVQAVQPQLRQQTSSRWR